ncbi:MAG: pyridoxamine 5'-phosphate oxidase family protein, partial [Nitrososphaerales archaeon]
TPHVTPTWFIYDESEKIIITTGENTVKVRNIQKNLNVAVLMDDGYSYVTVNGKARINNERKETRRQS